MHVATGLDWIGSGVAVCVDLYRWLAYVLCVDFRSLRSSFCGTGRASSSATRIEYDIDSVRKKLVCVGSVAASSLIRAPCLHFVVRSHL